MGQGSDCPDWEQFSALLSKRVEGYFAAHAKSRTGGGAMAAKVALGSLYFALTYLAILLSPPASFIFFLSYMLHGSAHLFFLLNIGHDANHGSLSSHRSVNRILSHAMDVCGISSRVWRITHHRFHHHTTNIYRHDEALSGRGFFRFSPHAERRPLHRLQHFYAPITYFLVSLDWIFIKDFQFTFGTRPDGFPVRRASPAQMAALLFIKAVYVGYMIAVPIFVFSHPATSVLAAFVLSHSVVGLSALILFQTAHVIEGSRFRSPVEQPVDQLRLAFETTVDCASESRFLAGFAGGLNTHVIHHIYPGICHVHYRPLTAIMRECAESCGISYRCYRSFLAPVAMHLRLIRRLALRD